MEQFNIQEYLDSGVIEMYVLDQLNDAEREAVEKLAAQYPAIRQEIAEVEEAMGSYNDLQGLTPPDYILNNIMEATATMTTPVAENVVVSLPKRSISMIWPMAAAIVGLALAAWMFMDKQSAETKLVAEQKQAEVLQAARDDQSKRIQALEAELARLKEICCSEEAVVKSGSQAIASVHWNKNGQLAHFKLGNLAKPDKDKQYQLWAFVNGNPNPVSVGVIDWDAAQKGMITFSFKNKPTVFAISLEKYGGSPTPTDVKGASDALKG